MDDKDLEAVRALWDSSELERSLAALRQFVALKLGSSSLRELPLLLDLAASAPLLGGGASTASEARALLDGGCRNLVVTLWPIRDDVARDFAPLFHRALEAGAEPSAAVRAARRGLRERGVPAADWAAFRLVGRD